MRTFEEIYSKRELITKIAQGYVKDIASIDILKTEGLAAKLSINIIAFNDVYLPITDACYLDIFENGKFSVTDYNLRNLNHLDKIYRTNLVAKIVSEIMSLYSDTKN
jgi:hypothetical protein